MISSIRIERFRGIRELEISGLGKVTLFVGRNDAGKTTLLEALSASAAGDAAIHSLMESQKLRHSFAPVTDYDWFWRPLFFDRDPQKGLVLRSTDSVGELTEIRFGSPPKTDVVFQSDADGNAFSANWELLQETILSSGTHQIRASGNATQVSVDSRTALPPAPCVIVSRDSIAGTEYDLKLFSGLRQARRDNEVLEFLRFIDDRIESIDILSPSGKEARLFIQFKGSLTLPLPMTGTGLQRCLDIALAVAGSALPFVLVDEIENGLHHTVVDELWRWIRRITRVRDLQLFCTTHSDECVAAAQRAFSDTGDDDLRVIRLDRRETKTTAAIYDAKLIDAAQRTDTEIRG
jgi:hypothetical protein